MDAARVRFVELDRRLAAQAVRTCQQVMPGPLSHPNRQASGFLLRRSERLIEVGDDVVDVFDADAEPNHLWSHPGLALFFNRHLPMGSRGRMAGQRFSVTQIDETLEQLERVVELLAGLEPSLDPEGDQRAGPAAEIFLRERVIGAVRESRVVDPLNPADRCAEIRLRVCRSPRGARPAAQPSRFPAAAETRSGATTRNRWSVGRRCGSARCTRPP